MLTQAWIESYPSLIVTWSMITELLIFTLSPMVVCLPMTDFLIELFSPMDILSSSMQSFPTWKWHFVIELASNLSKIDTYFDYLLAKGFFLVKCFNVLYIIIVVNVTLEFWFYLWLAFNRCRGVDQGNFFGSQGRKKFWYLKRRKDNLLCFTIMHLGYNK